jgi:hypothetical protein
MTHLDKLIRLFVAVVGGVLIALFLLTVGVSAQAAPPPLPLPDVTLYGRVTRAGETLSSGTVKAILPDGVAVTASIKPITGTEFSYKLVVPLYMSGTHTLARTPGGILTGDVIRLLVNDQPAFYQDGVTQLTMSQLAIMSAGAASTAAGRSYELNLSLAGPDSYPIGDVNANGLRNAADAMLALKYDIGMIHGVTNFPPGPNTVYLPLCDIVANGQCDSGDALRILQCDVGTPGVTCPTDRFPGWLRVAQAPMAGAMTRFEVAAIDGDDPTNVEVQVLLASGAAQFGAASLELHYDSALFAPVTCSENPGEALDMVVCNPTFAPGSVRFSAIAATGAADGAGLVTVRFQRIGAGENDLSAHFWLTSDGVTDQEGNELAWGEAGTDIDTGPDLDRDPAANPGTGVESPASATTWLYLPFLTGSAISPAAVTEEPAIEPPIIEYELYLPSVNFGDTAAAGVDEGAFPDEPPVEEDETTDSESSLPVADETPVADKPREENVDAVLGPAHLLYLPLVNDK